ncbi:hypothetical protein [Blastomonas sp. CCH1-A6]|jgi:hypothetical protein|uniref:hypothetical protein n=1 Tax=Blastomonas sp. CCH1-A6 TaxID=1768762 RepID=UPI00082AB3F4
MQELAILLAICASVVAFAAAVPFCWLVVLDNLQAQQDTRREERLIVICGGGCLLSVTLSVLSGVFWALDIWWAA